jgi:thiol-disulfide isomerase/thioredoxin
MVLPALAAVSQLAPILAQDNLQNDPSKQKKPAASLKVGDLAPALKVSKWLQGEEVKAFKPGKVYVIEFWSTTCAPCIAFMPHLAELQKQYQDKDVTIIGCTAAAFNDTEAMAAAFVKKRGPALRYRFAFADDRTFAAWMTAAAQQAIPCTFVVDRTGRIAYIGNPLYLGVVLDKVVAGASTAKEVGEEVGKIRDEFTVVSGTLSRGPQAYLRALKAFEAKYPALADFFPAMKSKLSFLPKYGKPGEAKKYAQRLLAKAIKREDRLVLALVSALFRQGDAKENKDLLALAVKAAEAEVRITGGKDAQTLIALADVHFISGDKAKAREFARKAVAAAADGPDALRRRIAEDAKRLGEGEKDKK